MKKPARKKILIWSLLAIGALGATFLGWRQFWLDQPQAWMKYPYSNPATEDSEVELQHYEQRVATQPRSALNLASLAAAYRKAGKRNADIVRLEQARQAAEKSLTLLPHFNPTAQLVLAQLAQDRHDFPAALALADRILRENPKDPQALSVKVSSNLALGRVEAAKADADYLARRFPGLASLTMRALLAMEAGREAEALADFEKAIRSEDFGDREGSAWARSLLGRHYLRKENLKTARFLLNEALRIQPEYPMAMGLLAELEVKEGHIERAEKLYRRAFEILLEPSFRVDLGAALAAAGRRAEAEALWTEAERQMRSDLEQNPYGHRGELVHLLLNRANPIDFPEAVRLAEAEADVRKNRETMETLAWAHRMAGARTDNFSE